MSKSIIKELEIELADLNKRLYAMEESLATVQAWQHKEMGALAVIAVIMTACAKVVLKL